MALIKSERRYTWVEEVETQDASICWRDKNTGFTYVNKELELLPPSEYSFSINSEMMESQSLRICQTIPDEQNRDTLDKMLGLFTDKELRAELNRRAVMRKQMKQEVLRCRDCKHCQTGYTDERRFYRGFTTVVCALKPKLEGRYYYATSGSQKACDKFEPRLNGNE